MVMTRTRTRRRELREDSQVGMELAAVDAAYAQRQERPSVVSRPNCARWQRRAAGVPPRMLGATMDVRSGLLAILATPHADTRWHEGYLVRQVQEQTSCRRHEVWEVLWGLVGEGLVYLDPGGQDPDNWRWKLSAAGVAAVSDQAWEPREPEGYLRRLRRAVPDLDPIVDRYLEEALRAFNARCYLSSSVMLGVAAERSFLELADSIVSAFPDRSNKLASALSNPRASQHARFTEARKVLEPARASLPQEYVDTLTLDAVADLLRVTRNDAGHPTGTLVDADTARTHLLIAGGYFKKMAALQKHLAAMGNTSP